MSRHETSDRTDDRPPGAARGGGSPAIAAPAPGADPEAAHRRRGRLRALLERYGSVLVGYSGGVDSVYLAHQAVAVLGPDLTLAVTGVGPALAEEQREVARTVAERFGIPWRRIRTREMEREGYVSNPSNRCYHCKTELYERLADLAGRLGFETVVDGTNADDASDYRPGVRAAREWGVRSPLQEAGLRKRDIRFLSREAGLPTWEAPASPCLASRLPYGVAVTRERLWQVEEAERVLRGLGVEGDFRVRHHAGVARLELPPASIPAWSAPHFRRRAAGRLAGLAFRRVVLDLEGYASGSLNRALVRLAPSGARPGVRGTGSAPSVEWEPDGAEGEIGVLRAPEPAVADLLRADARRRALAARARAAGFRYAALDLSDAAPGRRAGVGTGV